MKKWVGILGVALLLIGLFSTAGLTGIIEVEELNTVKVPRQKSVYIRDEIKEVIIEINKLGEKYKYENDYARGDMIYINIYEDANNHRVKEAVFHNRNISSEEYFNDLVEILDKNLAKGLKNYVDEMKVKELKMDKVIVEKVGRAVVYSENRIGDGENYISIIINFSDIEDEDYRDVFDKISNDKYILGNVIIGENSNLLDIGNPNIVYDRSGVNPPDNPIIRYNIFFQDKDIEKVNILIQGKSGSNFKDEDIDVFINLLNNLELKGKDKDLLINKYKDTFKNKKSEKISVDNYNILIKGNKGNTYGGRDRELIYFSIERK